MKPPTTILIIGTVWPEPASSAAGSRMMQLIYFFKEQGSTITFASAAADSAFMFDLESIAVNKVKIELNSSSFDSFVSELKPTIVLFDRFMTEEQFGWRVAEHCADAIRILDTEDLHCLRIARQKAFLEKREFEITDLVKEDVAKREIASILRCDLSLIISEFEMDLLKNIFKIEEHMIFHLPFMLPELKEDAISKWPVFEERANFISIGNFLHEPNWNSVLFLKEEIWPMIRKELPQAELFVYGAYPSQKVNALHDPKTGFIIKGRADDAKAEMKKARLCLAPLRFGAGIKGKLTEAMRCGTPSVTTPIGAEGMHGALKWNGTIASDPKDIAAAAVNLYIDKVSWKNAQASGIEIINSIYSEEKWRKKLDERLSELKKNLVEHRNANFAGAMLMHHTISGSKYMAKWIEEKNKKA